MNEELVSLLDNIGAPAPTGMQEGSGQAVARRLPWMQSANMGEMVTQGMNQIRELTPELRGEVAGVVNENRRNRLSGISNFLATPEAQMALLSFGRAFSRNDPGSAGTILADAGEGMIRGAANARALKASAAGENIAEAGGAFADSNLVAGLQARREEVELAQSRLGLDREQFQQNIAEFDAKLGLEERRVELAEVNAENDLALNWARYNMDEDQFEARLQLLKDEKDIKERLATADIEYKTFLMTKEQDVQNIALRTNEYLGILDQQIGNTRQQIKGIDRILSQLEPGWTGVRGSTVRSQARAASSAGIEVPAESDLTADNLRSSLEREKARLAASITSVQNQRDILMQAQSARLGAEKGEATGAGGTSEGAEVDISNLPEPPTGSQGSRGTPMPIRGTGQLDSVPAGGYFRLGGKLYRKGNSNTDLFEIPE